MARKKIREYDSKRLPKEHLKRISGIELQIKLAQVTEATDFNELAEKETWLSSERLVVKPDMLFGKRGKSGLVGLNFDLVQVASFTKERLEKEVKSVFIPTAETLTSERCSPLVITLPLEIHAKVESFIREVYALFLDLDFTFLEMNLFTLLNGEPYPLDMRGELDDTAAFKNFNKVMSPTESIIHGLDEKTSASQKFTVLNPKGRIWTMVAGGGASVIYDDTVYGPEATMTGIYQEAITRIKAAA